ncbi:MAG: prolyl aminopeptidase [Thiotrichales bacterium]
MYPAIKPFHSEFLDVGDGHELYLEQSGSIDGEPVLFLHGGPGGGCIPAHRRFFDPEKFRIILFDQRGAGQSRPHASLQNNTTANLIADIEKIRAHLGIRNWLVFGGSWGSTLALAYAQAHPDPVNELILRGIFLCRDEDIHWFYQEGASRIFPDHWEAFVAPIPAAERDDLLRAYHRRLTGNDELARMRAAEAWSVWEGRTSTLQPSPTTVEQFAEPHLALALARIECHYFMNHAFLERNQLLDQADRLAGIPGTIVHGRYDVICPIDQAYALHRAWPDSKLQIIAGAGHSAAEPGISQALIKATDDYAARRAGR